MLVSVKHPAVCEVGCLCVCVGKFLAEVYLRIGSYFKLCTMHYGVEVGLF